MPPPEQNAEFLLSIVVMGRMNPQIHHPYWYRVAGILTEDEVAEALTRPVVVSPDIGIFDMGNMRISCMRERWEILAFTPDLRPRMASIAAEVFDAKLKETPINMLAFNNDSRHQVPVEDVERLLASRSAGVWGMAKFGPTGASASLRLRDPDSGPINVRIEPAADASGVVVPGKLFIAVNSNHPIQPSSPASPGVVYFELKKLLDEHFDADFETARNYTDAILASLYEKAEAFECQSST